MRTRRTVAALAATTAVAVGGALGTAQSQDNPVVIGFIGSFASDAGLSTLRGAQVAIDEINAAGGMLGGRQIKLVRADTREDVTEGIKAYEYLNEVERADFIVSGSIDDVSLGWLPRMVEYRTPTLDTWTSYIGIIDKVVEDYENHKMYFMNVANDYALAALYVDFGKDILAKQMGWKRTVILQEDTAFGGGVQELMTQILGDEAGIEIVDTVVYDTNTVDFAPIFSRIEETDADFIYIIASVNSQVPISQYVKLQVQKPMTGIIVAAFGLDFWNDTGGAGGGVSTLSPYPGVGLELDDTSQGFIDEYRRRWGNERPIFPHFNGFNAYYGVKNAVAAAERAGGFEPLDDWVREMEQSDTKLYRDGELWMRYSYWKPGEIEPRTGRKYTHNIRFDITPPYDDGPPSMIVVQWYDDGSAKVVYPPKYANGEFELPSWISR